MIKVAVLDDYQGAFLQIIEDIHSYIKGDHFTEKVELSTDV